MAHTATLKKTDTAPIPSVDTRFVFGSKPETKHRIENKHYRPTTSTVLGGCTHGFLSFCNQCNTKEFDFQESIPSYTNVLIFADEREFLFNSCIEAQKQKNGDFYKEFKVEIDDIIRLISPLCNTIPFADFRFSFVADESITITFVVSDNEMVYLDISLTHDDEDHYFSNCGLFINDQQNWSHVGNLADVIEKVLVKFPVSNDISTNNLCPVTTQ